jgi:hypothetical protein
MGLGNLGEAAGPFLITGLSIGPQRRCPKFQGSGEGCYKNSSKKVQPNFHLVVHFVVNQVEKTRNPNNIYHYTIPLNK